MYPPPGSSTRLAASSITLAISPQRRASRAVPITFAPSRRVRRAYRQTVRRLDRTRGGGRRHGAPTIDVRELDRTPPPSSRRPPSSRPDRSPPSSRRTVLPSSHDLPTPYRPGSSRTVTAGAGAHVLRAPRPAPSGPLEQGRRRPVRSSRRPAWARRLVESRSRASRARRPVRADPR